LDRVGEPAKGFGVEPSRGSDTIAAAFGGAEATMSLTLYMHPLSSFCHKVLIALYESAIPFTAQIVNLRDPTSRETFAKMWPIAKFPVLRDESHDRVIPESTVIIEYLARHYAEARRLLPEDPELAAQVRASDRFYDLHIHEPMQKVVDDRLRPPDCRDPFGVGQARERLQTALRAVDADMASKNWAVAERFSMADCAAAPALFYTNRILPLAADFPHVRAYLNRLMSRPSYARALAEAQPYLAMFPA
jgi:glutathione S-transferase